jgi:phosphonoacetaldehyde hydrolase
VDLQSKSPKRYRGAVRAVIFDWAGTTVDYGSKAPVDAFLELFRRHGVAVSAEEARKPMGSHKRDHIRLIAAMPPVVAQWERLYGRPPSPADVGQLYGEFVPLQTEIIGKHADVIPGVPKALSWLREHGARIGSTTGYTREMMTALIPLAAAAGFDPDAIVCADEVPSGRPAPWMAIVAAMRLGVYPMEACVKVGDTLVDVAEGLNAGMWTVGVAKTGNELGLSQAEVAALPASDLDSRLRAASQRLLEAGAHYAVDEVTHLPDVIGAIEKLLAHGERP